MLEVDKTGNFHTYYHCLSFSPEILLRLRDDERRKLSFIICDIYWDRQASNCECSSVDIREAALDLMYMATPKKYNN